MSIAIDMTGVEAFQGGGIVPEGQYLAEIVEAKEVRSAIKQTPGVECVFEIVGGPEAGRKLYDTLWVTTKAAGRVKWCLEAAGIPVPNGQMQVDPFALQRKRVKVTVRHEQYEKDGEQRTAARVQAWDAPTSGFSPAAGASTAASDEQIPF